jgi:hypothetical protein
MSNEILRAEFKAQDAEKAELKDLAKQESGGEAQVKPQGNINIFLGRGFDHETSRLDED